MEQYITTSELYLENLRNCLDWYTARSIFIRDCGGIREDGEFHCAGLKKVREDLEEKKLDFRKNDSGLHILIDSDEVFHFPFQDVGTREGKGFSIAYERIDADGRMMFIQGKDPYDLNLPEPCGSMARDIIDDHLIEISFKGRINLKFHSWMQKPHFKYWTVEKP
ncbi:hypothetical protein HN865_02985 [Candidatus Woesearchaeota archaeon]|jgi:hypothetical protein|nr:hypothetical protein [Candidatus Woesearchaeota archaeon]MBT7237798.1 hypothetical protein [Candidatus Woesearchaeota archaeon]